MECIQSCKCMYVNNEINTSNDYVSLHILHEPENYLFTGHHGRGQIKFKNETRTIVLFNYYKQENTNEI